MSPAGLPDRVRIREVGPRDGFQNEPEVIATGDKVRLIDMLSKTGIGRLEVTSFVRPDVIPQLADAEQVLEQVERRDGVGFSVLVPNERGLERALGMRDRFDEVNLFLSATETHNQRNVNSSVEESLAGLERTIAAARGEGLRCEGVISVSFGCPYEGEVNLFLSATETHNQRNVNSSVEESLAGLERTIAAARGEGLRCEGVISVSFGCPYEGEVPAERVFAIAERLAAAGCEEVAFGDTTGMANPRQVQGFFTEAQARLEDVELTAHFHNTRGQGLANVLAAVEEGVESFESSFGELGGCPVPPGSTGNVSTEDVVSMLHEMGIETGIDLRKLIEASRAAQDLLGRALGAHVLRAGPVDWHGSSADN